MIPEWDDLELYKLLNPYNGICADIQGMIADPPGLIKRFEDHFYYALGVFEKFEETMILWTSSNATFDHFGWRGSYRGLTSVEDLNQSSVQYRRCYILDDNRHMMRIRHRMGSGVIFVDPVLQDYQFKSDTYLSHLGLEYVEAASGHAQVWTLQLTKAAVEPYRSNILRYFRANNYV